VIRLVAVRAAALDVVRRLNLIQSYGIEMEDQTDARGAMADSVQRELECDHETAEAFVEDIEIVWNDSPDDEMETALDAWAERYAAL
jgi:hypothetical protein